MAGKNAGNFAESAFFAKIRFENICEFSYLRENSLHGRAGNLFARAGNLFRLFDVSREFGAKSILARHLPSCVKDQLGRG